MAEPSEASAKEPKESKKPKEAKKKDVQKTEKSPAGKQPDKKAEKKPDKKDGSKAKATEKVLKEGKTQKDAKPPKDAKAKKDAAKEPASKPSKAKTEEAEERRAAAAAAAAAASASKKRKKEEAEPKKVKSKQQKTVAEEPPAPAIDERVLQQGVVEIEEPEEETPRQKAAAAPRGACAAEALDVDYDSEGGAEAKAALAKPGQAGDSSRSRSRSEQRPKAKEKEKEKDRQKEKVKEKAKEKDRDRGRDGGKEKGRRRRDSPSSYDDDYSGSDSEEDRRQQRQRRQDAGLKMASGFGLAPPPTALVSEAAGLEGGAYGPAPNPSSVALLPPQFQSLVPADLAADAMKMKLALQAASNPAEPRFTPVKEEVQEQKLKMGESLREALLDPTNEKKLLARTGLLSASMLEDQRVLLRAPSKQALKEAMGILARVAHHCQWGCHATKVGVLLCEKPEMQVHTVLVRLAATSSKMETQEGKVSKNSVKLRVGTEPKECQIVLEGIPGISRKHVTITFEHDKGACYVQDMSTNGTRLNGKRLPRPPFRNPVDARVRLFHGDELVLAIAPDGEELGFIVNLMELSS